MKKIGFAFTIHCSTGCRTAKNDMSKIIHRFLYYLGYTVLHIKLHYCIIFKILYAVFINQCNIFFYEL